MALILADTSAWIEYFHKNGDREIKNILSSALDNDTLCIIGPILFELLRGTKTNREYDWLQARLEALHYLPTPEPLWRKMSEQAYKLERKGITIPGFDFLVAFSAIEHNCMLLQRDRHFSVLAKHTGLTLLP